MAKRYTADLALLITTKEQRDSHGHYYHIIGRVVRYSSTGAGTITIRNLSQSAMGDIGLADLEVDCQGGGIAKKDRLYGFSTEFKDVFAIDAARATAMAKTLTRLDKQLRAYREAAGAPADFADYVFRVSEALGIQTIVQQIGTQSSYDDNQTRLMSRGAGVEFIRSLEQAWIQKVQAA